MKHKFITFTALVFSAYIVSSVVFASAFSARALEAFGMDSIAGYETYVYTSPSSANSEVVFDVVKPSGEHVNFSASPSSNGSVKASLFKEHTEEAGTYSVAARAKGDSAVSSYNTFVVSPGDVSVAKSTVDPSDQVVDSLSDSAEIVVDLSDDFGNPIEDHLVRLVSSSASGQVKALNDGITDEKGQAYFSLTSNNKGAVTYTIYDVTSDVVLDQRARVAFMGGSYLFASTFDIPTANYAASGAGGGIIDRLAFEDVDETIGVGQDIDFTLVAQDASELVVEDYAGKVRFSVVGSNAFYADLPDDYSFTVEDLGSHTFSISMSFQQPGSYLVEARDMDNTDVVGEYTFNVGEAVSDSSTVSLTSPAPGTYGNNIQTLSGVGPAGKLLKIRDNDVEIGQVVADAEGAFSFSTSQLTEGVHEFTVVYVNDIGTIVDASDPVSITIDTSAPEIGTPVFDPVGPYAPGDIVKVRLLPAEELSQAALLFNNSIFELIKGESGYYEASFALPVEFGEYFLSFVAVDELGNESRYDNYSKVQVGGVLGQSNVILGDVTNLVAVAGDKKVTLTWNAPQTSVFQIQNYRVYYGTSPTQLTEAIDTFTNSTTWYLPNLKNDAQYFFAVIAVDDKGNISEHFSNIVSAHPLGYLGDNGGSVLTEVPVAVEPFIDPTVAAGTAGEESFEEMSADVSDTGPEITWLIFLSFIAGYIYTKSSSRRNIVSTTNSVNSEVNECLNK